MYALRRLRVPNANGVLLRRGNASLQSAGESGKVDTAPPPASRPPPPHIPTPAPAPVKTAVKAKAQGATSDAPAPAEAPTQTSGRRRRNKTPIPPQRPAISSATPRKWNRPLAEGVLPAYDLALKVIRTDSVQLEEEARGVRVAVAEAEARIERELGGWGSEGARVEEERLEGMRKKLHILEVQSQVNLPEVRWRVANGMVDMTKPVHRHLMEQKWRKEGGLDLLMERIHQMKVIPDVLPDLHPSIELQMTARTMPDVLRTTKKVQVGVEPGTFLLPEQTIEPPKLYANVFHTDTRFYTLLLVDPDVPNEEQQSFNTFLHWMKPNVPLSATHRTRILDLNSHTPYIPPHPQRGTPYHRYVLLLLPQAPLGASTYTRNAEARAEPGVSTSVHLEIPPITDAERRDFDVRAFARRWGLDGAKGGGAHMWREVWSEGVSQIYADILKEAEPRYGRPPKADPYAELKQSKRYV